MKSCYVNTNQILGANEALLKEIFGFSVKLHGRITDDFSRDLFSRDCRKIQEVVSKIFHEYKLKEKFKRIHCLNNRAVFERMDPYLIALKLCIDKYPFIIDEEFGKPFGRSTSMITKSKKNIDSLLKYDKEFLGMYNCVIENIKHENF